MKLKLTHKEKLALMYVLSIGMGKLFSMVSLNKERSDAMAFDIVKEIIVRLNGGTK